MKLILTASVDNLGVAGDIVEVKPGYARNYLLPRNKAIVATRGAEKQIEDLKRARLARQIRDNDHAREVKEILEALEGVTVRVKTATSGKLFGSVNVEQLANAIKAAGGPHIEPNTIQLKKGQIKTTGTYQLPVALHDEINATVKFEVVSTAK